MGGVSIGFVMVGKQVLGGLWVVSFFRMNTTSDDISHLRSVRGLKI